MLTQKHYTGKLSVLEEKKTDPKKDYFEYNIEFKSDMKFKYRKDNKNLRVNLLTRK